MGKERKGNDKSYDFNSNIEKNEHISHIPILMMYCGNLLEHTSKKMEEFLPDRWQNRVINKKNSFEISCHMGLDFTLLTFVVC
jgi:hypothetical protein